MAAERSDGDLRLSAENLQAVATRFPESADVHRELGICYYLERRYRSSRDEFINVQAIAPDDLTAHYYLALLYRRLGLPSLAQQQARAYEDEKSDPSSPTIALRYLSSGQELYGESLSTHVYGVPVSAAQVSANEVTPVSHPRLLLSASEGVSGQIGKEVSNNTGGKHLK